MGIKKISNDQFNIWRSISQFIVWIYDLDDTLMWNQGAYNKATIAFVEYLNKVFENRVPPIHTVTQMVKDTNSSLLHKINLQTRQEYGLSSDRFPDSLALVYCTLCEQGYGVTKKAIADECRKIGRIAFLRENYEEVGLVPGAKEVLSYCSRLDHMVLVTKGEEWVQETKIDVLGLRKRWFHDIRIVDNKICLLYLGVLKSLREAAEARKDSRAGLYVPSNVIVVGNSFSSDIMPALALGMRAIYIPCATGDPQETAVPELTPDQESRLVQFKEISEIVPWMQNMKAAIKTEEDRREKTKKEEKGTQVA